MISFSLSGDREFIARVLGRLGGDPPSGVAPSDSVGELGEEVSKESCDPTLESDGELQGDSIRTRRLTIETLRDNLLAPEPSAILVLREISMMCLVLKDEVI